MTQTLQLLIKDIEAARTDYIKKVTCLSPEQSTFKPTKDEWSVLEVTEHLVRAEEIGIFGMFNAIEGVKRDQPIWKGDSPNAGESIEQIVEKTWQPKEIVPDVAAPRWGGTLAYWISKLESCKYLLEDLLAHAKNVDPRKAIYPHPISGPMDIVQRFDFLRFHIERHLGQVMRVMAHSDYPK